jgi:hypothetical protein
VLAFGFGILAVLGSFWGIVWFIRSYVEPPRVMRPSPLALAARDSTPVKLPSAAQSRQPDAAMDAVTGSTPAAALTIPDPPERAAISGGIADRWSPLSQAAPATSAPTTASVVTPAPVAPGAADPAPAPTMSAATSLTSLTSTSRTAAPDADATEEVAEGSVPAISGPAPLPRRRPKMTASATKRSNAEPPLPRPRPDGPAPQSVFTAVPVADDRFPTQ